MEEQRDEISNHVITRARKFFEKERYTNAAEIYLTLATEENSKSVKHAAS
jgi:hypothetical protein